MSVCELSRVSLDRPSDARSSRASRHVDARDMRDDDDDDAFCDVDAMIAAQDDAIASDEGG